MTPRDTSPAEVPSVSGETHSGIRNLPCYLASHLAPGPTLLVGASPLGLELATRARAGDEVIVADRCSDRLVEILRYARQRGLEVRTLDRDIEREPLGLSPRSIANVVCLDALEGFRDDVGVLEKLHRVLMPDGRLVVRVAAHPWASHIRKPVASTIRRFDAEALRDSLEEAGFRPLSLRHWNFLGIPGTLIHERVLRRAPDSEASVFDAAGEGPPRHWWDRGIDLWFRAVENRVGFPIGVSLVAVATPYLERASVRSVEPGRVFTARPAREAYEPMAVGR